MRLIGLALLFLGLTACNKESSQGSNPPQITFISLSPQEFKNGEAKQLVIGFEFFDQDGDIGTPNELNVAPNLILKQTFDTNFSPNVQLPRIPPEFKDPEKGIRGVATVLVPTEFFVLDSAHHQTGDTFHFEFYIKDQEGNESNKLITPDVYILP